jgi:rod shape-determining protein MreD
MFPVTAYIISKLMKILQSNIVMATFVTLIGIAILEMVVYEINFLIHVTAMEFPQFITIRLIPTLILNFIFIILVVYTLKKQFEKMNELLT